jgi:hypothetical protein
MSNMAVRTRTAKDKKHTTKWHMPRPRKPKEDDPRAFASDMVAKDRPGFHKTRDNR